MSARDNTSTLSRIDILYRYQQAPYSHQISKVLQHKNSASDSCDKYCLFIHVNLTVSNTAPALLMRSTLNKSFNSSRDNSSLPSGGDHPNNDNTQLTRVAKILLHGTH